MKTHVHRTTCARMFIAALFIIVKTCKTWIFITRRMYKQILLYSYIGILLINRNNNILIRTTGSNSKTCWVKQTGPKSMHCMPWPGTWWLKCHPDTSRCGVHPWSVHIQEGTNGCINNRNSKSLSLSFPHSLKSILKKRVCTVWFYLYKV